MSVINEEDKLSLKLGGRENGQKIYNTINLLHYIDELPIGKMYGIQRVTKDITILTKKEVVLKQKNEELKEKIKELEDENYVQKKIIFEDCIPKQKVKDLKESVILDNTIVGGRRNGKTLEYGIKLGKIKACEELLED